MRKITREANGAGHNDDQPPPEGVQERTARLDRAADVALMVLLVIAVIGSLSLARAILVPVVAAVVLGLMLGPVVSRATRIGIPPVLSAVVLLLAVVVVFNAVILLMTAPAVEWIGKAPEIGQTLKDKAHILDRPLAAFNELRKAFTPPQQGDAVKVDVVDSALIQPVLAFLTPALGQLLIFFGTLFFFLAGRPRLRQSL